jgi:hypothetical protein
MNGGYEFMNRLFEYPMGNFFTEKFIGGSADRLRAVSFIPLVDEALA